MRYAILAVVLALGGCVTADSVNLPNGTKGYSIDCGGPFTVADCMNKAAALCQGPYQIVGQENSNGGAMLMPVGTGAVLVPSESRIMIVSCDAH